MTEEEFNEELEQSEELEEVEEELEAEDAEEIEDLEEEAEDEVEEELEDFEESDEDSADEEAEESEDTEDSSEDESSEDGLSDEELDQIADTAIAALQDILKYFDLGEITIEEYMGEEDELILDITGDNLAVLIGRHGRTLEALQFVISSITARKLGFRYPVVVDVEGYKNRQRAKLESMAINSAKKALNQDREISMRPMSPYERRIIHMALRDFDGVETESEDEGNARHVVIRPI